jgi:hypothetical protein
MAITQTALGLDNLTHEELGRKIEAVGTAMEGNPSFPSPPVPPADLIAQAADLRAQIKARADVNVAARAATASLRASRNKAKAMLVQQSNYVAIAADGDDSKAKSAAMALKQKPVYTRALAAPKKLSVSLGDQAHEVKVSWRRGSRSTVEHRVETTTDPSKVDSWTLAGATTSASFVVDGVVTGVHSFRVVAVNGNRSSRPSGVVTLYVP